MKIINYFPSSPLTSLKNKKKKRKKNTEIHICILNFPKIILTLRGKISLLTPKLKCVINEEEAYKLTASTGRSQVQKS